MAKSIPHVNPQTFYLNFFSKYPNLFDGRNSTKLQSNDGDSFPDEDRLVYPTDLPRTKYKPKLPRSNLEAREIQERIIEEESEM
jgi:hypothetical protein